MIWWILAAVVIAGYVFGYSLLKVASRADRLMERGRDESDN